MVRPRWQELKPNAESKPWRRWNQAVALFAATNLTWVIFDITYIPLRNFWVNRKLYLLPSTPLVLPLSWLPNITHFYDPVKGIIPDPKSQSYIEHFEKLDETIKSQGMKSLISKKLHQDHLQLTQELINKNRPKRADLEVSHAKVKSLLETQINFSYLKNISEPANKRNYFETVNWNVEREFWKKKVIPLLAVNYSRMTDENGRPLDSSWRIDLPFQLIFLLDLLLKAHRLKYRFPAITWRDAFLRRWIDLPFLLPFWRLLRLAPVTERLSKSKLIQIEPIRAVISQGVVALLSVEIFEIFTLRILDSIQNLIRSPLLPKRIRGLCSYQSVEAKEQNEIAELIRLWLPLILTQIGPNMRPQFVALFDHALQKSMERLLVPDALKKLVPLNKAESALSYQLATGMTDAILDLSRNAGDQLGQKDVVLEKLGIDALDQFWEELASTLENEPVLQRSQDLSLAFLESLKRSSFRQLKKQGNLDELITELDGLNFSEEKTGSKPPP